MDSELAASQRIHQKQAAVSAVEAFAKAAKGGHGPEGDSTSSWAILVGSLHDALKKELSSQDSDDVKDSAAAILPLIAATMSHFLTQALAGNNSSRDVAAARLTNSTTSLEIACLLGDPKVAGKEEHHRLTDIVVGGQNLSLDKTSTGQYMARGSKLLACLDACKKVDDDDDDDDDALKTFQPVREEAEKFVSVIQHQLAYTAQTSASKATEKVRDIAKGDVNGRSWKENLPESSWAQVLKAAKPLLNGSTGHLVAACKSLKQETQGV